MKIINQNKFNYELEWLFELKKSHGHINESIISLVDHKRNINALTHFIERLYYNFGINFTEEDKIDITGAFRENNINYYSVKEYIIDKIEKMKVTCWYRYNKNKKTFEYNHLEYKITNDDIPKPFSDGNKYAMQNDWKNHKWTKTYADYVEHQILNETAIDFKVE